MRTDIFLRLFAICFCVVALGASDGSQVADDPSPRPDEQQLPKAMHSAMKELPVITVGRQNAHLTGSDNVALQAAVDYIAALGGGTVVI